MRDFRLRDDLVRAVIDGFALPLGIEPGDLQAPSQGYTLAYTTGEDDEPDTYTFHVVVTHDMVGPVLKRAFRFLPDRVFPIVEIGSRDAYRTTDVYISPEPLPVETFLETWEVYEPILLEDGSIGAGANSDDPFVEVFLDQWKGISIHCPLDMRDEIEAAMQELDLEEVVQTWPQQDERSPEWSHVRPVLDLRDEFSPDIDELLLDLRHGWRLELNVDPDTNVDESGRNVGLTLWHAVVIMEPADDNQERGAYGSVWATAGSLAQMEGLIDETLRQQPNWSFSELYTIDRVAFDERPDDLSDLPPRRTEVEVHMVQLEPWSEPRKDPNG